MAVVFVTRMEGDKTFNEGLCLQCARELGIKPVEDLMNKMGISGDELDAISEQMMAVEGDEDSGFEMGGAQAFPFLNSIFGGDMMPQGEAPSADGEKARNPKKTGKKGKQEEKKYVKFMVVGLRRVSFAIVIRKKISCFFHLL